MCLLLVLLHWEYAATLLHAQQPCAVCLMHARRANTLRGSLLLDCQSSLQLIVE